MDAYQTTDAPVGPTATGSELQLRRIGVLSAGKMMGATYGVLAAVIGILYGLGISLFSVVAAFDQGPQALLGILVAGAVAVFIPVLYGVVGFLFGLLMAAVYNLIAGRFGGLTLEFSSDT